MAPSAFVRECAETLVRASRGKPILDVACGSGRNGLYLASFGCEIVFIDRDLTRLQDHGRFNSFEIDLARAPWPIGPCELGGIVNVHFLLPELFPHFAASLAPGAYLLLETVPGCGCNYRELPKAGRLRQQLAADFDLALRANIDETVLPVIITEQGENRNQCEEQRNLFGCPYGFARRGT